MKLTCLSNSTLRFTFPHLIFLIGLTAIVSCAPVKRSYYFKGLDRDTTITGFIPNTYESKIKKGDNLSIIVSSLSSAEDGLFNQSGLGGVSATAPGYIVDDEGKVLFHRLGLVKVEGLTRRQLEEKLQTDLLPYMKDPIVNVNYLNKKVTVIGEVGNPQTIEIPGEQIPLLEVLIQSGGITISGRRDKVVIIREIENQKQVNHVNLEDLSVFTSPFYYVQPNDVIFVLADEEKQKKEDKITNLQKNIGYISAGISFLFLIVGLIFR